jgi:hypothetical protein
VARSTGLSSLAVDEKLHRNPNPLELADDPALQYECDRFVLAELSSTRAAEYSFATRRAHFTSSTAF